ncbi:MAG TPA: DUF2752 domain-containing protein [Catenuloplanes sp.]
MTSVADPAADSGPEQHRPDPHRPGPHRPDYHRPGPHGDTAVLAPGQYPAVDPAGYPHDPAGYPRYVAPEPDRLTRFFSNLWVRSPRWLAPLAGLGCIAGAVGYTMWTDPTDASPDAVSTCLLRYTTGFDCPGCGGTRAFWYLLHGDLPAAARHHLLFVFAVPFVLYVYLAWAGQRLFGRRLPQLRFSPRALGVFLAVWGIWSVLRNLPWAPFTWLYV